VEGRRRIDESLALAAATKNPKHALIATAPAAIYEQWYGDPGEAFALVNAGIEMAREHELLGLLAEHSRYRAWIAAESGFGEARSAWAEALEAGRRWGAWVTQWGNLENLALWWIRMAYFEPAAVLLGSLEANGLAMVSRQAQRAEAIAILESQTGGARWMAAGAVMDREDVVDYALGVLRAAPAAPSEPIQERSPVPN